MSKDNQEQLHRIKERFKTVLGYDAGNAGPEGLIILGLAALLECQHVPGHDCMADVREFMHRFEIDYDGPPRIMPVKLLEERMHMADEEHEEWHLAVREKDEEAQLDALIDKIYVDLGTILLMGAKFHEAWERVHQKNMQKTIGRGGREGKKMGIVKPNGWTPPDLSDCAYQPPAPLPVAKEPPLRRRLVAIVGHDLDTGHALIVDALRQRHDQLTKDLAKQDNTKPRTGECVKDPSEKFGLACECETCKFWRDVKPGHAEDCCCEVCLDKKAQGL